MAHSAKFMGHSFVNWTLYKPMPVPKPDLGATYIFGIRGMRVQESLNKGSQKIKWFRIFKKTRLFCNFNKVENEILNTRAKYFTKE